MAGKRRKKRGSTVVRKLRIMAHHPGGDLVSIQISARLKRVPKGLKITKALLADMVRRKAESSAGFWDGSSSVVGARAGKDPKGIELKIIRWRNPGRKSSGLRGWRQGTQADAWGSLREPLAAAGATFR
jgi:hypothetical protein